jgi:small subunit ribosomal protein S4e
MSKFGLKRISAPKTWDINKKERKFALRPFSGSSNFREGLTLCSILRDYLKFVNTMREAKFALNHKEILVNGKRKKNVHHIVGFMEIISFPDLNKDFRIIIDKKGKLRLVKISKKESEIIPLKIKGITVLKKGQTQVNLSGSKNILTKKKGLKLGDSLLISIKDNKIKEHFKLEKGAFIILTGGKHVGEKGLIEKIENNDIIFKTKEGKELETKKKYAYVLGKGKSSIKLEE